MLAAIFNMKKSLTTVVIILTFFGLSASPQVPDILIYKGDTLSLFSNPLELYLKLKGFGDDARGCNSSACGRGYVATWLVRNDSLFLMSIKSCSNYVVAGVVTGLECENSDTSRVMKFVRKEFNARVTFASWYSGDLLSPQGRLIQYVHMGYSSTYERELQFKIENGLVKGTRVKENSFPDTTRIDQFNYQLIQDTLFHYMATRLDWKKVGGEMICDGWYLVKINRNGRVTKIKYDPEQGESKWRAFWWNLSISDCRRTLKRPVGRLDFNKMIIHGGQIPRNVKLELYYSDDTNELTLEN